MKLVQPQTVISLADYKHPEVIKALELLLAKARRGEISGLGFAFKEVGGPHRLGLAGDYLDDACGALGVAGRAFYRINMSCNDK